MFTIPARTLAATAAAAVLSIGIVSIAHADETPTDSPCAAQEAKVAKAEAALARITAVFEAKKDKVAEAEVAVAAATTEEELAAAVERLAKAQEKAAKAEVKKAQKQRLAKAKVRLAECEAAQTV